jgi:hypothetical protein
MTLERAALRPRRLRGSSPGKSLWRAAKAPVFSLTRCATHLVIAAARLELGETAFVELDPTVELGREGAMLGDPSFCSVPEVFIAFAGEKMETTFDLLDRFDRGRSQHLKPFQSFSFDDHSHSCLRL